MSEKQIVFILVSLEVVVIAILYIKMANIYWDSEKERFKQILKDIKAMNDYKRKKNESK